MSQSVTPSWPPELGAKVLHERVTDDPGPSYVVSEPYETEDGLMIDTLPHHGLPENPVKSGAELALELDEQATVESRTRRVDRLKYYTPPDCDRCGSQRTVNQPVEVSINGEQCREWLCMYCYGYREGESDMEACE